MTDIEKEISEWTGEKRREVLAQLLKRDAVGTELGDGLFAITFSESIAAGQLLTLQKALFMRFRPKKIVILEHEREQILTHVSFENVVLKRWFKKDEHKTVVKEERREKVTVKVSRSIWSLQAAFAGQRLLMPSYSDIGGELLGPDSQVTFLDVVADPGLYLTLQVRNNSDKSELFEAVVLGEIVAEEQPDPSALAQLTARVERLEQGARL